MRDRISFKAREILGKRPIKKGDVIMKSEPFAYAINSHMRGQYCDYCLTSFRKKSLVKCNECSFLWYCDDVCRFGGQSVHKFECAAFRKLHPREPAAFTRLILRVMNRLKNGGENYMEYYEENKGRKFRDLMNHYRDIKEDDDRMREVRGLMDELKEFADDDKFPNESDFIGIYGRVLVNRYCLMDDYHTPIGSAVYLAASIFDHSCVPNAYPSFEKNKVVIRSLVDWSELDYSKVCINYIELNVTKQQRIEFLRSTWYFICKCPLCSSNDRDLYENCIKCENPMCGELIQIPEKPDSPFSCRQSVSIKCSGCKCILHEDTIGEYQSTIAFTRQRIKGMKEETPCIDTCLAILEKQSNLIPSLNAWRVRTLDYAFNATYQKGVWIRAMTYGNNNLEAFKFYYGQEHPTVGLFLMKLSKVCMYLKIYRDGIKYGEEAERILTIALGPRHILITEELDSILSIASEDIEILLERRLKDKKQNEHESVCKHCGKKKGIILDVKKNVSDKNQKKISENKCKKITDENNKKIINKKLGNTETNGELKKITHGESNKLESSPKTKQMCKFVASGETNESLSKRVLEYLLSLQDF